MNRSIRVLELRSVRGTGGGPEKTIILGTAMTDRSQFAITVCDLRDRGHSIFELTNTPERPASTTSRFSNGIL